MMLSKGKIRVREKEVRTILSFVGFSIMLILATFASCSTNVKGYNTGKNTQLIANQIQEDRIFINQTIAPSYSVLIDEPPNDYLLEIEIEILAGSTGFVEIVSNGLGWDIYQKTIIIGPGQTTTNNYVWRGHAAVEDTANLALSCILLNGTEATIAFRRDSSIQKSPFGNWLNVFYVLGGVVVFAIIVTAIYFAVKKNQNTVKKL